MTDKALQLYKELGEKHPRSNSAKRIPLRYATGEDFVHMADAYIQSMLRKGVPSLFVSLKKLYADREKEKVIENLVESYRQCLIDTGKFSKSSGADIYDI